MLDDVSPNLVNRYAVLPFRKLDHSGLNDFSKFASVRISARAEKLETDIVSNEHARMMPIDFGVRLHIMKGCKIVQRARNLHMLGLAVGSRAPNATSQSGTGA